MKLVLSSTQMMQNVSVSKLKLHSLPGAWYLYKRTLQYIIFSTLESRMYFFVCLFLFDFSFPFILLY